MVSLENERIVILSTHLRKHFKLIFFSISVMLEVQKLQLVRSYDYIIVNICVNKEPFSYYSNTVNPLSLNKVLSCTIYYCNCCLENNFLLHLIC